MLAQRSNNSNSQDVYTLISIGTDNSSPQQAEQIDKKRRRTLQSSDGKK
jgi:hypothetical protein